jgi:hypothetical protein
VPFRYGIWLLAVLLIRVGLTIQKRRARIAKPVTA